MCPRSSLRSSVILSICFFVFVGVEVVRAPLTVSVCYKLPVSLPRKVNIRVSENTSVTLSTASFSLEDHRTRTLYLSGQIKHQTSEKAEWWWCNPDRKDPKHSTAVVSDGVTVELSNRPSQTVISARNLKYKGPRKWCSYLMVP